MVTVAGEALVRKIANDIKRTVGPIVALELKDPRVGMATVTAVDLSPDLRHACIYVSVLGDEEAGRAAMDGLESARGFIRREMGSRMELRYVPEIVFELDRSYVEGSRLEELIRRAREEDSDDEPPGDS